MTPDNTPAAPASAAAEPALRLPSSPYPGLRPFLDHEEMLMFGRQTQVEDIVRRLGRPEPSTDAAAIADMPAHSSRFVAVLGGSGSGKSSLIRAGVVPFLRQFGIPEAGDLWESVVATPGTNFQPDADGVVHESPITRLARKFERVLRGPHQRERCEAIEQTLRRPGGLGLMVEQYGAELNLPDGVQADKACVLLVIDQFEELFHKTNAGLADARLLIERVIDHYHQARNGRGCDRCYLAITMRSEHLNDCAGYLGLPEAINAGGYLVSRLDDAQVREVIEKPAQRYLRLRQRERQALARQQPPVDLAALPPLPRAVVFEPGVVDRLIHDTSRLANNPDHLPLLQHALSRIWSSACQRQGLDATGVPDEIRQVDLWRAAQATTDAPLAPEQNVLELSLDRWAEQCLAGHTPEQRKGVLNLLRRLAYKDPRSGTYNQQRLYVASHPLGVAGVRALVEGRWIDEVDYLHWDAEDPKRITLKVSHESFIRGWKTLRELTDNEAYRLEQFMALLAATQTWVRKHRRDTDVLDQRMLGLMSDVRIEEAIGKIDTVHDADGASFTWQEWHAWLAQLPQGQALVDVTRADVRGFYRQSLAVLKRAQDRGRNARHAIMVLSTVVGVTLLSTGFAIFVQQPVLERSQLYFSAAKLANQVSLRNAYPQIGGSHQELQTLLKAADLIEQAGTPDRTRFGTFSDAMLGPRSPLQYLPLADLLDEAAQAVEPPVNGKLRSLLTRSIWRTANSLPTDASQIIDSASNKPVEAICSNNTGLLKPVEGTRSDDTTRRGIFVSSGQAGDNARPGGTGNRLMFAASVDGSQCQTGKLLQVLPGDRKPAVMFDALLGYMMLAVNGDRPDAPATVSVQRVRWDDLDNGLVAEIHQPLAVVFNDKMATALRRQASADLGMAKATWRMAGGRGFGVADEAWRVVADNAQRLVPQPTPDRLQALTEEAAKPDRPCQAIKRHVLSGVQSAGTAGPDGSVQAPRVTVLPDGGHCLVILRSELPNPPTAIGVEPDPDRARDQVNVRAFVRPGSKDLASDGSLVSASVAVAVAGFEFGRMRPGDTQWFTGLPGSSADGWLVLLRQPNPRNPKAAYNGVPWSTGALHRLGKDVLDQHRQAAKSFSED